MEKTLIIKIEVWEKGDGFHLAHKYFNSDYKNDFNEEVAKLSEQVKQKNG